MRARRKRCTECRQWYEPSPHAEEAQKVCGPKCRQSRRSRQGRRRRAEHVQDERVDERERQQRSRKQRRAQAAAGQGQPAPVEGREACHVPGEACKHAEMLGKVLETWDREMELSLASLHRKLARILGGSGHSSGTGSAPRTEVSRASLGAEVAESAGESSG